jgi:hypothetical protein
MQRAPLSGATLVIWTLPVALGAAFGDCGGEGVIPAGDGDVDDPGLLPGVASGTPGLLIDALGVLDAAGRTGADACDTEGDPEATAVPLNA